MDDYIFHPNVFPLVQALTQDMHFASDTALKYGRTKYSAGVEGAPLTPEELHQFAPVYTSGGLRPQLCYHCWPARMLC